MDLHFTEEQLAFRDEVRGWLGKNLARPWSEEARDANAFLAQDFDNMLAVNEGMKSRGWSGARTNPVQEVCTVNFHRALDRYLLSD